MHVAEEFITWLREKYPFVRLNIIPAGCTSKVQIADIVLNRPFKVRMKTCFVNHTSDEVLAQLRSGVATTEIVHDLSLTTLKPLTVKWMLEAYEHLKTLRPVVCEAYETTGMMAAWRDDTQVSLSFHINRVLHLKSSIAEPRVVSPCPIIHNLFSQRNAMKMKSELFANSNKMGIPMSMKPEEAPFSASDRADLDDNEDDDTPLIELARRSMQQAKKDGPWEAVNSDMAPADPAAPDDDDDDGGDRISQDTLLQVPI